MKGIDEICATDLIDLQAFSKVNNGIKYLLTVIYIFSKFVWSIPLKRNTRQEVTNAFWMTLKQRRPTTMWVDKGCELHPKTS